MSQSQRPADPGDGGISDHHVHCAQIGRIVAAVAASLADKSVPPARTTVRAYVDLYLELAGALTLPGGSNPVSDPDNDDDIAQQRDPDSGQVADILLAAIENQVRGATQPEYVIATTLSVMDNLHPRVWSLLRDRVVFSPVVEACFAKNTAPLEDRAIVRNALDAKIESSKVVAGP